MFRILITSVFFMNAISGFVFAAENIGKAISLEGETKLNRNQIENDVKAGDLVYEGDLITTGNRSSARFLLTDDTIIDLKENSHFRFAKLNGIEKKRDAEFSLDFGKVRASVNKKIDTKNSYKIKTKATVFAVRGTDFSISANEIEDTKLTVFEGNVLSQSSQFKDSVPAGFELVASNSKFKKNRLTPAQIDSIFESSRTEDMNFFQNLVVGDFHTTRNFGSATIQSLSKMVTTPAVQIPRDAFKVPGVNQLSASAIAPGMLNFVITNIGVKIQ